jgi:hypothetical protein
MVAGSKHGWLRAANTTTTNFSLHNGEVFYWLNIILFLLFNKKTGIRHSLFPFRFSFPVFVVQ